MTEIILETEIKASPELCFDLARNVEIHLLSAKETNEKVINGRKKGLCELNDEVTWEARHFGIKQKLTVKITKLEKPFYFEDIMLEGAFKTMVHRHYFENKEGSTIMKDVFMYEVPFGFAGRVFNHWFLKNYMTKFLIKRNQVLKSVLENSQP